MSDQGLPFALFHLVERCLATRMGKGHQSIRVGPEERALVTNRHQPPEVCKNGVHVRARVRVRVRVPAKIEIEKKQDVKRAGRESIMPEWAVDDTKRNMQALVYSSR